MQVEPTIDGLAGLETLTTVIWPCADCPGHVPPTYACEPWTATACALSRFEASIKVAETTGAAGELMSTSERELEPLAVA